MHVYCRSTGRCQHVGHYKTTTDIKMNTQYKVLVRQQTILGVKIAIRLPHGSFLGDIFIPMMKIQQLRETGANIKFHSIHVNEIL